MLRPLQCCVTITNVYIRTFSFYPPTSQQIHVKHSPFMSSTSHSSFPHLTFSLLSPLLPILWVSAINANHWNDRKIDFIFFLTEREIYRRLVLLESLQSNGSYSPWSYLGQNTRLGNFFILLGIFWLSTYCKTKLENSCFYFIWSSLWVTERTL